MWRLLAITIFGCGSVQSSVPDGAPSDSDPPSDTGSARCDPSKPFGDPVNITAINSTADETCLGIVADESEALLTRVSGPDIALFGTTASGGVFAPPSDVTTAPLNSVAGDEYCASPVSDGLIMYFHRQDPAGIGIELAFRTGAGSSWAASSRVFLAGNPLVNALSATISADGQTLYWLDFGDFRIRSATRGGDPAQFDGLRTASSISLSHPPVLSADELTLFYTPEGGNDILVTTRASTTAMFGTGVPVPGINSSDLDLPAALSQDGCTLYIASSRPGGSGGVDLWVARRPL